MPTILYLGHRNNSFMALSLKVSNSLEHLASDLTVLLKNTEVDVFMPHRIITQTDGMNIWLKQKIAQHLGIAANIQFLKPNDIVFNLYKLLGGKFEEQLSRENLVWLLYHLLGSKEFEKRFKDHATYLNEITGERDNKRLGLAEKVADLFDQYQIYRQEIIDEWNNTENNNTSVSWQAWLWIRTKNTSAKSLPDKTIIRNFILEEIKKQDNHEKIKYMLPHIFLFGLSIITKFHIEIFYELSKITDVSIYLLNPSPDIYWEDDKTEKDIALWRSKGMRNTDMQLIGNTLLSGWGKILQNTFRLLFRNDIALNNYETIAIEAPKENTLLQKIQNDIFHNRTSDRLTISLEDLKDESITIHNNYTIAREVQSFYNYLVHLADAKKTALSPRDIVVMVTDIDEYAPYIRAVFDNAPYRFQYNISDLPGNSGDTIYSALQHILNLHEDHFSSEQVMQLLEFKYIRKKFNLHNTDKLRMIIAAANIRFGVSGNAEDDTKLVSWEYGLKRIMFGICMNGEELINIRNDLFYPIDTTEGAESLEVIRFVYFIETLIDSIKKRNQSRNINGWIDYLNQTIYNFLYLSDRQIDEDYIILQESLKNYRQLDGIADEPIPFQIFSKYIVGILTQQSRNSVFISNGITFCSLIPMRSIPFKVIGLLGMNHDSFPRKENKLSFNLITQKPQLGDRNIKDNDKHLFLETVLSAKEYLFISYLGKSVSDNSNLPASVLVEELIDYIQSGISEEDINVSKHIVTYHSLHATSNKYNQGNAKLYRYGLSNTASESIFAKTNYQKYELPESINWKDVVSFFKNGPKIYYTKILNIYYHTDTYLLKQTENFIPNNLENYSLKKALFQINDEQEQNELQQRLLLTGQLPLKNVATRIFMDESDGIQSMINIKNTIVGKVKEETVAINENVGNIDINAHIGNVYNRTFVFPCFSKKNTKYMIEGYLNFLILRTTNQADKFYFIHGGIIYEFQKEISTQQAKELLQEIVSLYLSGLQAPYPICAELFEDKKDLANITNEALVKELEAKMTNYNYPLSNKYILQAYKEGVFSDYGLLEKFTAAFNLIMLPLQKMVEIETVQ